MISRVWIYSGQDRREAIKEIFRAADLSDLRGKNVLVKPNLNTADAPPGSSHHDTIDQTMELLQRYDVGRLVIGDRSGPATTRDVFEDKGIFALAKRHSAEALVFDEMSLKEYVKVEVPGGRWRNGFHFVKIANEVDATIGLCCLKTHSFGGHFTMSLKLATGMVHRHNMSELHSSLHMREMIAEMNLAYRPRLVVMDGVDAFFSGGPMTGSHWGANLTLASNDRVALDVAGVALLKLHGTTKEIETRKVFGQDQIRRAVQLGLGVSKATDIELVPVNSDARAVAENIGDLLAREA